MKNKNFWLYGGIIGFTLLFIASAIIFRISNIEILPSQFYGALIAVVISAIITFFLLQGQTANEEQREKSIEIFKKKQDVYHNFLEELKKIIEDGQITIAVQGKNADIGGNIKDELKDLLFQLGYIQMHTSKENTNKIFERVTEIIQLMNDFSFDENAKQKVLPKFYASLSEELFGIIAILKNDLYHDSETDTIDKNKIEDLLRECGLFMSISDDRAAQIYFWEELQKQLQEKGYKITPRDLSERVDKFYRGWDYINFPIYTTKANEAVSFYVEIKGDCYHGFANPDPKYNHKNSVLKKIVQEVSSRFTTDSDAWYGYVNLDWNLKKSDSEEFKRLKDSRKRQQLIKDIVGEMDMYITKFIEIAKKNEL